MKFTALVLVFLCKGIFNYQGEPCKKWVASDGHKFKVVYILQGEEWNRTVNMKTDLWMTCKDTIIPKNQ